MKNILKFDSRGNISPLLKKTIEKGFNPQKRYTITEIYGHFLQKSIGLSKWGVYAHRNSTGSKTNIKSEEYIHEYEVDTSGRRYLDTNFNAWPDHPKNWETDPIGTKYTTSTLMEFYRPSLSEDFEFIGFSGGKDSLEKVKEDIIRKYLEW